MRTSVILFAIVLGSLAAFIPSHAEMGPGQGYWPSKPNGYTMAVTNPPGQASTRSRGA